MYFNRKQLLMLDTAIATCDRGGSAHHAVQRALDQRAMVVDISHQGVLNDLRYYFAINSRVCPGDEAGILRYQLECDR